MPATRRDDPRPGGDGDDAVTGHGPGEGRGNDDEAALPVYAAPPARYAADEERNKEYEDLSLE
ncbi:MAG TPA: hypothetical protein PKJ93_08485 [Methanoculleus sp.]|nr:hypothetical protein [Methanoculleus sp.]